MVVYLSDDPIIHATFAFVEELQFCVEKYYVLSSLFSSHTKYIKRIILET